MAMGDVLASGAMMTFKSPAMPWAAIWVGWRRVMRRTEMPGLVEASSPAAKPVSAVLIWLASKGGVFASTIQAVRPRMNTAEPDTPAFLKLSTTLVGVILLALTWMAASWASASGLPAAITTW